MTEAGQRNDHSGQSAAGPHTSLDRLARRHFALGWGLLAFFVAWGVVLDAFHAFKLGVYLDVDAETRRFMWTLAHAHGVGLGLLQLGFATTLHARMWALSPGLDRRAAMLTWSSVLIPLGFFLGGLVTHRGDPSIGVFIVPVGGLLLMWCVAMLALELARSTRTDSARTDTSPSDPAAPEG